MARNQKPKTITYFEVPIVESTKWGMMEYALFAVESVYATILPFIGGMLYYWTRHLYWILLMILPIYLKLHLTTRNNQGIEKFFFGMGKKKK